MNDRELIAFLEERNASLEEEKRELVATLSQILRDQLVQTNLHMMPPQRRARLEKARAVLLKYTETA